MDRLEHAKALFVQALGHHNRNQLREAELLYRRALELAPDRVSILTNLSAVLIATERAGEARPLCLRTLELEPGNPIALDHLRSCPQAGGSATDDVGHLESRLAAAPDDPYLLNAYALALMDAGEPQAASEVLQRALTVEPANIGLRLNLALAAEARGLGDEAMAHYLSALRLQPDLEAAGQSFACLLLHRAPPSGLAGDELDALLVRALRTPWTRPQSLVPLVTARLLQKPALQACLQREGGDAQQGPLTSSGLTKAQCTLIREPLLLAILECALVADPVLERLLTVLRATLLASVIAPERAVDDTGTDGAHLLAFTTALAAQCFENGYAYAIGVAEADPLARLASLVQDQLDRGALPAPLPLAVLGCYRPLATLRDSTRLLAPDALAGLPSDLLRRQLDRPRAEARLQAELTELTPVVDPVSRQVQSQYEEHPYPRWTALPRHTCKVPLAKFVTRHVAGVEGLVMPAGESGRYRVLNAGCGTGQHPIDLMLRVQDLDMLAIDLSRTSLAYASRMAADMGIEHIEFALADILELGSLGRQFDLIDAAGVLHHLQSPEQGLAVLRQALVPHGILRIALYSERARQSVVACRAHIAEAGYPATDDGIRRLRQHVLALPAAHPARGVARFSDFFALQECRDLVFHVQEHRFDLLQIGALLARQNLRLLGLQLQPGLLARFRAHHGDRAPVRSLEHWDAFERAYPDTFADMFVLWTQAEG